jgi:hypothetical protein
MGVATFKGVVENGRIRLEPDVHLPDHTRVYVLIPDDEVEQLASLAGPRLAHREDAGDFRLEIDEEAPDAGV